MIQYSVVVDQPNSEPVSLSEAKTHLEWTGTSKDTYITSLITSARRLCEAYTGLSFVTQTRRVKLDRFPHRQLHIELPYGPLQQVTSFTYANDQGGTTTLTEGVDFVVDSHSRVARVFPIDSDGDLDTWPDDYKDTVHPITIEYQCGFDDVSGEQTPEQIKQAILMYVANFFEKRGDDQGKEMAGALPWECMVILDSIKTTWNAQLD